MYIVTRRYRVAEASLKEAVDRTRQEEHPEPVPGPA